MAPLARKATPTKNRGGARSLLTLLVLLAGGGSSHHGLLQGAEASCEEKDILCLESEICTECTLSFKAGSSCTEYIFDPTNACDLHGVSYCCAAEAAGLDECGSDPVTQEYLECTLVALGCTWFDMPCFASSGSAVGDAETRSSSSAGTGDPTSEADVLSSAPRSAVGAAVVAAAVALAVSFTAKSNGGSILGL